MYLVCVKKKYVCRCRHTPPPPTPPPHHHACSSKKHPSMPLASSLTANMFAPLHNFSGSLRRVLFIAQEPFATLKVTFRQDLITVASWSLRNSYIQINSIRYIIEVDLRMLWAGKPKLKNRWSVYSKCVLIVADNRLGSKPCCTLSNTIDSSAQRLDGRVSGWKKYIHMTWTKAAAQRKWFMKTWMQNNVSWTRKVVILKFGIPSSGGPFFKSFARVFAIRKRSFVTVF